MSFLAVINPASGDRQALPFFTEHVAPLLPPDTPTTIEPLTLDRLVGVRTVLLLGGDGTLHDILNLGPPTLDFVLVPCGTANALYASLFPPGKEHAPEYKLQSLRAYLARKQPLHLSLATATVGPPPKSSLASVVVSTSLHASILHDSEALRQEHPGIERFKIAAQQNSTKWYKSSVKLLPSKSTGLVQIYHPESKSFITHPASTTESPAVHLDGPFAYFLSTVNVDRLEPAFRIAPLVRSIPPEAPACDIVVLRPLRHPSISADTPEARSAFVPNTWQILTAAYQDGAHIHLTYAPDGTLASDPNHPTALEYFRSGGWEWTPDPADADAHLVCADGAISTIPAQGTASCIVDASTHLYSIYA